MTTPRQAEVVAKASRRGSDARSRSNADLVAPMRELRRQLEAASSENAQLRRTLVEVRAENRRLRAERSMPAHRSGVEHLERPARIRVMLSDPHSRNP